MERSLLIFGHIGATTASANARTSSRSVSCGAVASIQAE
jgi:hypothetical protein